MVGPETEAQEENEGGNSDQNPEGWPLADECAEDAANDKCQHAGNGTRRTKRAHGGRLLAPCVILGDQCHQRWHDHSPDCAAKGLGPRSSGWRWG
jgi:hypothetical protein